MTPIFDLTRREVVKTATIAAAVLLAGCATTPNAPVRAAAGQGGAQLERDVEACARVTQGVRGRAYAACMIARGYVAAVGVPKWAPVYSLGTGEHTVDVVATTPHTADEVIADLVDCRAQVKAALDGRGGVKAAELLLGPMHASGIQADAIEPVFRACLAPRGYTVTRWTPSQ